MFTFAMASSRFGWRHGLLWAGLALGLAVLSACQGASAGVAAAGWRTAFAVDKAALQPTSHNPYFLLEPGQRRRYQGGQATLTITVLNQTKVVDGVTTRILEEREEEDGQLVEVSRNYFACDPATNDVYYFGEDVDIYKNGKVASHDGAWLSGVHGAQFGLMMPGQPQVGDRFYQEQAPGVALDRSEIVSIDTKRTTPAGTFERCVKTKETSGLESGTGYKVYAPGVGLVQDAEFTLVEARPAAQ